AAAYATVRALGLSTAAAVEGLMSFPGLAHRMEPIGALGDVRFINDSKATNIDAARQAMSSFPRFRWIAGGRPKSEAFTSLADLFANVTKAYLIGEAAPLIAEALDGQAVHAQFAGLRAAVEAAFADARATGDPEVVLFSPACSSFDQFADFEARGEAFRAAVAALAPLPSPV
ncbi:MAG: cyanophycin synthetase, partial [Caulobacteraceae bacterium]